MEAKRPRFAEPTNEQPQQHNTNLQRGAPNGSIATISDTINSQPLNQINNLLENNEPDLEDIIIVAASQPNPMNKYYCFDCKKDYKNPNNMSQHKRSILHKENV